MAEAPQKKIPPLKAAVVERFVRDLLQDASTSDEAVRAQLEDLARQPAFNGLTWLWGPVLYNRNRVLFRPFILAHFSTWLFDPPLRFKPVEWKGTPAKILDDWLALVDRSDDIELFRKLYQWSIDRPGKWRPDENRYRADLLKRFTEAEAPAARLTVLSKFDIASSVDEPLALELYRIDASAAKPFILRHLPTRWSFLRGEKRELWKGLLEAAAANRDGELRNALYRRQVPTWQWEMDALQLCETIADPGELIAALERIHPEGYGIDPANTFVEILEKRDRDPLPYVTKHLRQVWSRLFRRSGYEKLLELARAKGWVDFWAEIVRTCANSSQFNGEVKRLLDDRTLGDDEVARRLLMLAGVSRMWNFPGIGFAQVHQLDEPVALKLYERFPELLRGPLKLHIGPTWGNTYPALVDRFIAAEDDELVDFLASRIATRLGTWGKEWKPVAEKLAAYYERLRNTPEIFSRRACSVLGQVPAYTIYRYTELVRENRLARLLFERSSSSFLEDPASMRDLVEAPEIHVQALAYRALALDDGRARERACENIELLLGTLLRPLHRTTRGLAFGALLNAARTVDDARRIHARAREALDLPDIRYPKEKLVGLIGRLLHRWPELRSDDEQPLTHEWQPRTGVRAAS